MSKEPWGYLRHWAADHRWSRQLVTGPLLVIVGPIGIGTSVAVSDPNIFLISIAMLLTGLLIMLYGLADYIGKPFPIWVPISLLIVVVTTVVVTRT